MAQPDFNVLRASMTNTANELRTAATEMDTATTEMDKIQNMAAVNIAEQLNQILLQIAQMHQNVTQLRQDMTRMEQNMTQTRQDMTRMEQNILQQLSRSEMNHLARLFNSRVADESHRLGPLYGTDNELMEDFPHTSTDINALDAARTETLLRKLGLPVNCRLDAKKKRFRRHIGLMIL